MTASTDSIDPRLHRLVNGELTPEEWAELNREAKDDPELQCQLEAFRPFSSGQLDALAQMGEANRKAKFKTRRSGGRLSSWAAFAGIVASASLGFMFFFSSTAPKYVLGGDLPTHPVSYESPLSFSLVSEGSGSRAEHVEVWVRTEGATERTQIALPVQPTDSGTYEVRGPAHRLTAGRFGPVELSFVLSRTPREKDAPFPTEADTHVAIVEAQVTVGAPPYALALHLPAGSKRLRSSPDPAAAPFQGSPEGRAVVELRPDVAVKDGLAAHLYLASDTSIARIEEAKATPVGTNGVVRFTLPVVPEAPARLIVAVGPKDAALSPKEVASQEPPPGWWFGTVPIDRRPPTAPESQE